MEMNLEDTAFRLAKEGKSNASIMGAMDISSGALAVLLQTRPNILFSIFKGRMEYIDIFLTKLHQVAAGELEMKKDQYNAIVYHIERASFYDGQLFAAHEVVLAAGSSETLATQKYDPATVTQLLRKK